MNINKQTITYWMKYEPLPNLEFLIKLVDYCSVDISYFFTDEKSYEDLFDKILFGVYIQNKPN